MNGPMVWWPLKENKKFSSWQLTQSSHPPIRLEVAYFNANQRHGGPSLSFGEIMSRTKQNVTWMKVKVKTRTFDNHQGRGCRVHDRHVTEDLLGESL